MCLYLYCNAILGTLVGVCVRPCVSSSLSLSFPSFFVGCYAGMEMGDGMGDGPPCLTVPFTFSLDRYGKSEYVPYSTCCCMGTFSSFLFFENCESFGAQTWICRRCYLRAYVYHSTLLEGACLRLFLTLTVSLINIVLLWCAFKSFKKLIHSTSHCFLRVSKISSTVFNNLISLNIRLRGSMINLLDFEGSTKFYFRHTKLKKNA